jgi:hypothetical protein
MVATDGTELAYVNRRPEVAVPGLKSASPTAYPESSGRVIVWTPLEITRVSVFFPDALGSFTVASTVYVPISTGGTVLTLPPLLFL